MNNDLKKELLLVGLPEAGKTSFLAALYHHVSSELADKKFVQYKTSANSSYLDMILSDWLVCKKQERTASLTGTSNIEATIHIEHCLTKNKIDLLVPDIAGEAFKSQFTDRIWDNRYKGDVENAKGLILFINPDHIVPHVLIDDHIEALLAIGEQDDPVPFNIEMVPTQVVLCDLLEHHYSFCLKNILPISIVVSAWDVILQDDLPITPENWIKKTLPLFHQYLTTNKDKFALRFFGISATGGNLKDPVKVAALKQLPEPGDRIIVQEGGTQSKNICAPIEWIMNYGG